MLRDIPTWFKILFVVFLILGITTSVYAFQKCGSKAFLLGNGALYAAASGMCDQ